MDMTEKKTDNMEALTRQFGPCGIGWKYKFLGEWEMQDTNGQAHCLVRVKLYIRNKDNGWSDPIPATGSSVLITKDDAYKMAFMDALGVAMKDLGVEAEASVYMDECQHGHAFYVEPCPPINAKQMMNLEYMIQKVGANEKAFCKYLRVDDISELPSGKYEYAMDRLEWKRIRQNNGWEHTLF